MPCRHRLIHLSILVVLSIAVCAQERVLDSLINLPSSGKPLLILTRNGRVVTDTMVADQVKYVRKTALWP